MISLLLMLGTIFLVPGCVRKNELVFAVGGTPNEIEYWEKIIDRFQDSTGIQVILFRQPTDTDQRRQSLVIPLSAKKSNPDVFLMDIAWIGQFAASDWLLPLDQYFSQEIDTQLFFSSIINTVDHFNSKTIALPVYNDCGLLYYRDDLLRVYNIKIPNTWEDLINACKIIVPKEKRKNPRFSGFVWQGAQYEGLTCTFLEFISSNNGGILNDQNKSAINSPENLKALQLMVDMIHKHGISPPNTYTEMKEEEVRIYFENGNALFERNWPYAWAVHNSDGSKIKGKFGITLLPRFEDGSHSSTLGGWHIAISKFSDQRKDAWRLIEYILSYEIQKALVRDLGWNPSRMDVYSDPEIIDLIPHAETLRKAFESAVPRPILPYYTQISEALQIEINRALATQIDPRTALENAAREIERIVETYDRK